jgi:hypothetical protein
MFGGIQKTKKKISRNATRKGNPRRKIDRKGETRRTRTRTRVKAVTNVPFKCRKLIDCMIFSQESKQILSFYNNFEDFKYFSNSNQLKGTGLHSNATVQIFTFSRQNISIKTLLKKAQYQTSDNLYYEHSAGMYINTLVSKYPCFIYTYGIYFNTDYKVSGFKRINVASPKIYELACLGPLKLHIMIQYIESITLKKYIERERNNPSFVTNMIHILFQIYGPLTAIGDSFTHYDLHDMNVLLYTIPNKQYINMEYRYDTHTVTFQTTVIAKIIDYGRAFFPQSEYIGEQICKEAQCTDTRKCGVEFGFSFLSKNKTEHLYWIDSYKKNRSHDLRLTQSIKEHLTPAHEPLTTLVTNVVYHDFYGTPENTKDNEKTTYNIDGFLKKLTVMILSPSFLTQNEHYHKSKTCKGTMITYMTGGKEIIFV